MSKPRIIIADTEISYIIPLQAKFVEDFYEKIDLEVITDRRYFEELFSTPQKVDILILSQELFSPIMRKHDIAHIFLMTEQNNKQLNHDNIECIFKYNNIKAIFNEIIGKSKDVFERKESNAGETQVIVVCSANGGTGKTTIAMGISAFLTKEYKNVLYINVARLQMFQHLISDASPIATTDVYTKLMMATDSVYSDIKNIIRKESFYYLPPFKTSLMSLGLSYSIYEKIINSAKRSGDYDFIIVDTESSFDEEKAALLDSADKVLIITNQSGVSVLATNILISNINGVNAEKYIFICNNYDAEKEETISNGIKPKYKISEWIEHFDDCEQMMPSELSKERSVQSVAFLVS